MDRPNIYLMLLSCILFIINRFDYDYKLKKSWSRRGTPTPSHMYKNTSWQQILHTSVDRI